MTCRPSCHCTGAGEGRTMVLTRRRARLEKCPKDECSTKKETSVATGHDNDDLERLTDQVFARLKDIGKKDTPTVDPDLEMSQPDVIQLDSPGSTTHVSDCPTELASSLQPVLEEIPYFSYDPVQVERNGHSSNSLYQGQVDALLKKTVISADFEKKECAPPMSGPSKHVREKSKKAARLQSTGSGWFDMPAPQLTPELKNDLRLLRMRNALDPSRHYKANDSKQLPRYFQVGRVVSDASEFYSSRIPRRQQKQSLVEELLSNEETRTYHKKKYLELQAKFSSGTRRLKRIKHKKFKK